MNITVRRNDTEQTQIIEPDYILGLDLGQARDYTALCIIEKHGKNEDAFFHARHLQRFQLGTPYPKIVSAIGEILKREPLSNKKHRLAIDQTGVGAPVVDLFKQANFEVELKPIHITAGATVNYDKGVEYVPKRNLVSIVQVALQTQTLKIAASLHESATLVRELQNFQVKITDAANDTYGAWREGTHDDLVLAVALALYIGTKPVYKRQKPVGTIIEQIYW
jgi:sulfur relay (sulfurtransferase) DsrF/TusC family protein